MNRLKILGIPVNSLDMSEAVEAVHQSLLKKETLRIMTANAEMIMQAQGNPDLKKCLINSSLVVADGAGVVWAAKELGAEIPERVAGVDLAYQIIRLSAEKGFRVFFLGAGPGVAEMAAKNMKKQFSNLHIVGVRDGFFKESDEADVLQEINQSRAEVLFVALGSPKQELWLEKYKDQLHPYIRMGVGGTFDVMADRVSRAPLWMQKNSLEWLYRGLSQPTRWRRLLVLPKFIMEIKKQKKMDK